MVKYGQHNSYTYLPLNHLPLYSQDGYNDIHEHPRGSIVEQQGLYQDGLNSLRYNGLKTQIIIAHVCEIF